MFFFWCLFIELDDGNILTTEPPTNLMVKTYGCPVKIFPWKPIHWFMMIYVHGSNCGGFGHRPMMIPSPKLYNLAIKHGVMENYSSCSLEILVPIANSSKKIRRIFRHLRDCKHLSVCMTFHSEKLGMGMEMSSSQLTNSVHHFSRWARCTTKHLRGSPRLFPPKKVP